MTRINEDDIKNLKLQQKIIDLQEANKKWSQTCRNERNRADKLQEKLNETDTNSSLIKKYEADNNALRAENNQLKRENRKLEKAKKAENKLEKIKKIVLYE